MTPLLDWVEKAALENIKFHLQNADNLARESSTTLAVFLAGIGGALAYVLRGLEADSISSPAWGAIAITCYLVALSVVLIFKCMKIAEFPAPTNEPKNLMQPQFQLDDLRRIELDNVQVRIVQAINRNEAVAHWLNLLRLLALVTPVIFGLAVVVAVVAR